jgi:hypothetical protein
MVNRGDCTFVQKVRFWFGFGFCVPSRQSIIFLTLLGNRGLLVLPLSFSILFSFSTFVLLV